VTSYKFKVDLPSFWAQPLIERVLGAGGL